MLYPKIKHKRGTWDRQWRSTKTGFRMASVGNGYKAWWRWLKYPFSKKAWESRSSARAKRATAKLDGDMTNAEAEAAYDAAPPIAISDTEIESLVKVATANSKPHDPL